ncbi:MAG: lysophospholipid acyltransferase family protein [Flammeovirgaceae bacterium]|nr:MAG: lysophospholipid acyltransferase family protein [Flammeovirgaceae bacterium]
MKPLISVSDFTKATGIRNKLIAGGLMQFAGLHDLNKLYEALYDFKGVDFTRAYFRKRNIRLEVDDTELARIPKKGAFITISNHPYGGIDGLALIELIARRRPDYKVLANFLLKKIEPISDFFIAVNPFEDYKEAASSIAGMKLARKHVETGRPLGIFPAGEVSTRQRNATGITDKAWQKPAIKLIKNARVPVIPIYFHGHNSWSFHLLGRIHPALRTLRLPYELTHATDVSLRIRIGNPITVEEQDELKSIDQFSTFLRARTYSLGLAITRKKNLVTIPKLNRPQPVTEGISPELIEQEIEKLAHLKLFSQQNFDVYLAPAKDIPNILLEIGRLRELTFRQEGEGTNKKIDLDQFDEYYEHLFLYDREASRLAGAYRIGKGNDIIRKYGRKGFYTNTLFKMKDGIVPVLNNAIELGRSFIIPEYQNKRLPLFLLWRGILTVLVSNPHYCYIIGPVSISNYYSKVSKSVIVAFIQKYYFDQELAAFIQPKKRFKVSPKIMEEANTLLKTSGGDVRKLDKIIDDIEPAIRSAPVLLKKYIQQNARIIGFNVDPKFNEALDGLMILDFRHVNKNTIENLQREFS